MSFDLKKFQQEHAAWVKKNFPDQAKAQNRHQSFLGVVEEVGELAHAMLKYEQRIREYEELTVPTDVAFRVALMDGVGDLVVFLAGVCDTYGLDLEQCIELTWIKVKSRDWTKDPQKGGE